MIVVIADDLSSAAEMGGVAAQLGFTAEVQTAFDPSAAVDVVVLDTDSRSLSVEEAARRVEELTRKVVAARPDWIYKKVDSVLRGPVRAEVEAVLASTHQARAVLIPANPARERIIRNGTYLVNGVPLVETTFADDPQYPARSANVVQLLQTGTPGRSVSVTSLGRREPLSRQGIQLPDVEEREDLAFRAETVDETTLPAGGADFFDVLLQIRGRTRRRVPRRKIRREYSSYPSLMVCGSGAAWDSGRAAQCRQRGIPSLAMPAALFEEVIDDALLDAWVKSATRALDRRGSVLLATGHLGRVSAGLSPEILAGRLVEAAARVGTEGRVGCLYLEGGATAKAFLKRMGWTRLAALRLIAPGMPVYEVSGRPQAPLLFAKPGSYPWPDAVWPRVSAGGPKS